MWNETDIKEIGHDIIHLILGHNLDRELSSRLNCIFLKLTGIKLALHLPMSISTSQLD
jgi:hypothetical protein